LSAALDRSIYVIIEKAMHISIRQFQLFLVEEALQRFFLSPWKDENAENIMSRHYRYEAKLQEKSIERNLNLVFIKMLNIC
jgi:hypothetical protein